MTELAQKQTCPYCGHEEDEAFSNWEMESQEVKCGNCHKEYSVRAVYTFVGFEAQRICGECFEIEENCYCEAPAAE